MKPIIICILLIISHMSEAQNKGISLDFKDEIDSYLEFSVPIVEVEELIKEIEEVIVLDAREIQEYEVSKIPGAIHIGYDYFDKSDLSDLDRDRKVVVYCSIGYRSEKIAEVLKEEGFREVYNLYGSIFAWVNAGYPIIDSENKTTNKLHTYNRKWSQWVIRPDIEKVW